YSYEVDDGITEIGIDGFYIRCSRYVPYLDGWSLGDVHALILQVKVFHDLIEQHQIYLILLFISIAFSQFVNIVLCTTPIIILIGLEVDIFESMAVNFPGVFKYFVIIFLSRGLSICESKMIEKYVDFHHNNGRLYFWFDDERMMDFKSNHVSFDLSSFKYLEKVMNDEYVKEGEEGKIEENYFDLEKCSPEDNPFVIQ
ncbi:12818_t:CDS:2, partial [Cetraspora pellucida]